MTRILALFLTLGLILPAPAHALRPMGVENAGLEEDLSSRLQEGQVVPAGLEESAAVQEELVKIASNPNNEDRNPGESLEWLSDQLKILNEAWQPFSEEEMAQLPQKLLELFSLDQVGGNSIADYGVDYSVYGNGRYFIERDFGSGGTMQDISWDGATGGLVSGTGKKDREKKRLIYNLFQRWEAKYRLPREPNSQSAAAAERFQQEVSIRYPSIRLVKGERASASRIEVVIALFQLLPESMLRSETVRHRLRGGIHLAAPRDESTRGAHYIERTGELGVQPTHFSPRGFIQFFLHEFGHVIEPEHLGNEKFQALFRRAKADPYVLPLGEQSGETRRTYIERGGVGEFFSETLMHYVLHGELMAQGFPGFAKDQSLWKEVYDYYRDHVFYGIEYRIRTGRLVAIPADAERHTTGMAPAVTQQPPAAGLEERSRTPVDPEAIGRTIGIMRIYGYTRFPANELVVRNYLAGILTFQNAFERLTGSLNVNLDIEPGELFSSSSMNPAAARALLVAADAVAREGLDRGGFMAVTQYAMGAPLDEVVKVLRSDPEVAKRIDESRAREILEEARQRANTAAGLEEDTALLEPEAAVAISAEERGRIQSVFDKLLDREDVREALEAQRWIPLDAAQARGFGFQAAGGFIVADSAPPESGGRIVVADDQLRNEAVSRMLSWVEAGESVPEVVRAAAEMGMAEGIGNVIALEAEPGITRKMVEQLIADNGLAGRNAAQVVMGTPAQIEALPVLAFEILSKKDGLPPVVVLSVAVRLQDKAGNAYTLLLMA